MRRLEGKGQISKDGRRLLPVNEPAPTTDASAAPASEPTPDADVRPETGETPAT